MCEGINDCYLQDESKTWEDDAVDKDSLEEVLSIVRHCYQKIIISVSNIIPWLSLCCYKNSKSALSQIK